VVHKPDTEPHQLSASERCISDLAWSREIAGAQVASDEFVFSLQS
jgi:hypothetical protein